MRRFGLLGALGFLWICSQAAATADGGNWWDAVTVFGSLDVRMESYWLDYESDTPQTPDDVRESEVFAYRGEIGVDLQPNPYLVGRVSFIHDAPEDRNDDPFGGPNEGEAWISGRYPWIVTPYVVFGRLYLPVGQNDTYGVTDTLVFRLTETWQTAFGFGLFMKWFHLSAYFFNGGFDRVNSSGEPDDDTVDEALIRFDLFPLAFLERIDMAFGAYWLSDSTETRLDIGRRLLFGNYTGRVGLWGAYLRNVARITDKVTVALVAELANTGAYRTKNYRDNGGEEASIRAYNLELAALLWQETLLVGGRFEAIAGLDWLGTQANDPDYEVTAYWAASAFVGIEPADWASFEIQYRYGQDNEGNLDQVVTERLKLEF